MSGFVAGRQVTAVLSGGGAKTAAQLGALEALHQAGVIPTRYVATSLGAVIAALAAMGLPFEEIMARLLTVRRRDVFRIDRAGVLRGMFARSLLRPEPFRATLRALIGGASFAGLQAPLTVTATDLDTGELLTFGAGGETIPLLDALCASTALPPFFPPFLIGDRRCADGGLRAVVPLEAAARFAADLVIAIDVGPGFDVPVESEQQPVPALIQLQNDVQRILMASNTAAHRALWLGPPNQPPLLWIRPRVRRGDTFAVDQLRQYREEGKRAARTALEAQHT